MKLLRILTIAVSAATLNLQAKAFDFTQVARANYTNVYCIHAITNETSETEYSNQGTGFYIGSNYILTNCHVIQGSYKVELYNTNNEYVGDAKVIQANPQLDIAVLFTKRTNKTFIAIANSDGLSLGEDVTILGFPHGHPLRTEGTFDGWMIDGVAFACSAQVDHGNSGGPILNSTGKFVGMVALKLNGESVAISSHAIAEILGAVSTRLTIGVDLKSLVVNQ